jgi:hypothetical protein
MTVCCVEKSVNFFNTIVTNRNFLKVSCCVKVAKPRKQFSFHSNLQKTFLFLLLILWMKRRIVFQIFPPLLYLVILEYFNIKK